MYAYRECNAQYYELLNAQYYELLKIAELFLSSKDLIVTEKILELILVKRVLLDAVLI